MIIMITSLLKHLDSQISISSHQYIYPQESGVTKSYLFILFTHKTFCKCVEFYGMPGLLPTGKAVKEPVLCHHQPHLSPLGEVVDSRTGSPSIFVCLQQPHLRPVVPLFNYLIIKYCLLSHSKL